MPNLYLQQSDGTPVATFRLYHDFAARAGQEEVVVLGIIPDAASVNPAPAGSYTRTDEGAHIGPEGETDWHGLYLSENRRAEKAERERDEARVRGGEYLIRAEKAEGMRDRWKATANSADDVIRAVLRELGAGPDTDPVLKAKAVCDARDAWREVAKQKGSEQPRPLTPNAITDETRDRAYRAVAALSVCDWDDMSGVAKGRAMALVEAVITEITRPEPSARPGGAAYWDGVIADQVAGDLAPEVIQKLADIIATKSAENGA